MNSLEYVSHSMVMHQKCASPEILPASVTACLSYLAPPLLVTKILNACDVMFLEVIINI